jgi:hypothetical protein
MLPELFANNKRKSGVHAAVIGLPLQKTSLEVDLLSLVQRQSSMSGVKSKIRQLIDDLEVSLAEALA